MASLGGADMKVIRSEGSLATAKDCDTRRGGSYSGSLIALAPIVHLPAAMK